MFTLYIYTCVSRLIIKIMIYLYIFRYLLRTLVINLSDGLLHLIVETATHQPVAPEA